MNPASSLSDSIAEPAVISLANSGLSLFFIMGMGGIVAYYLFKRYTVVPEDPLIAVWKKHAHELGLTYVCAFELEGARDGFSVKAEIFSTGSGKNKATRTRITVTGNLPTAFSIKAEGFMSKVFGVDIEVGDPVFDKAAKVLGDESAALSVLDAEARETLQRLVPRNWAFEDGAWVLVTSGRLGDELSGRIAEGIELAHAVRDGRGDVSARLKVIAATDPLVQVRRRALERLVADFAVRLVTREALIAAVSDVDPTLRLFAALQLGNTSALADLAQDAALAAEVRLEAFEGLVQRAPHEARTRETTAAWLTYKNGQGLRAAALSALSTVPHDQAQSTLIEALVAADEGVKLAAIRSLGAIGTVEAVAALGPLRDTFFGSVLKGAASDAILAIQSRVGSADAGALSIAGDGGGLAITEIEEA